MADKTMPPTQAPTPTADAMPGEMGGSPDMAAPSGGKVMVEMPSDAFDSIYALVTQLASGLDALKADVEAQKKGSVAPASEPAPSAASSSDEEFLKGIAAEGSMR